MKLEQSLWISVFYAMIVSVAYFKGNPDWHSAFFVGIIAGASYVLGWFLREAGGVASEGKKE